MTSGLPRCIALVGRLGTPQLACLRSWRRQGVPVLFVHDGPQPLSRLVMRLLGVPCVNLGPLQPDDAAFVARFAGHLQAHGVDAVTCVSEPISEALWAMAPQLPPGLRLLCVQPAQVRVLESKFAQDATARAAGLPALQSWRWWPGDAARTVDVPPQAFPLVVRPDVQRAANPGFKLAVVKDPAALRTLVAGLVPGSSGVIAQPLVRGPNLLVHGYRSADGRWGGHVAFRVDVKHRGFTVRLRPVPLPAEIARGCRRMEQALDLCGVYHWEFVQDETSGAAWFLDLNPRFGGTTGKVLAAGYDEPLALLGTAQPGALKHSQVLRARLHASGGKHQALVALVAALRRRSTDADYPYPKLRQLLPALLHQLFLGRDEILRLADARTGLAFAAHQITRRLMPR